MIRKREKIRESEWQRINMRTVDHLLGAEFIHNLYDRHMPRINSIRFRNTKTIYKNRQLNSFSPKIEFDMLQEWLGERFFQLDSILLEQVQKLVNFDRKFFYRFLNELKKTKLTKLNNIDLGILLIKIQDFILGELYPVNLVQIEYSLTNAIERILRDYYKNDVERRHAMSLLISSSTPTEFQKEEDDFERIVLRGKKMKVANPRRNSIISGLIKKHFKKYQYSHCAYGELPRHENFFFDLYKEKHRKIKMINYKKSKNNIKKGGYLLKKLNDNRLKKLVFLAKKIGEFRDGNKAKLGETIRYRLELLDEISNRGIEDRKNLNWYLLWEILNLLKNGIALDKEEIEIREKNGVEFIRSEYLETLSDECGKKIKKFNTICKVNGKCASPGKVSGICKTIFSLKDADKLKKGEIMVAIGTDFDLMDAIHRSSGVVTEEGGILSHAAVVCREMEKPCCIGVENATKILKDGMFLKMDATLGEILIVKK